MTKLGADEVSERGVDEVTSIDEVDAVIDAVGKAEFGAVFGRLRVGGRMVIAGAIAGPIVSLDVRQLYLTDDA